MEGEQVLDEASRELLLDEVNAALDSLEVARQLLEPVEAYDDDEFRKSLRQLEGPDRQEIIEVATRWRRRCLGMRERAARTAKDFEERLKEALDLSPEQSEKLADWVKSEIQGAEAPRH